MRDENAILVGDVGGTNIRLGLAERDAGGRIHVEHFTKYKGDNIGGVPAAIEKFSEQTGYSAKFASLALAGPITNGRVTLTNRPWTICSQELSAQFEFEQVQLHNDFSAMARSVPELQPDDFRTISAGQAMANEPIIVAGPGTGFGTSILAPNKGAYLVISSEGGHQAYAPRTKEETELLHILQAEHDFVSLELVSSGQGMDAVHAAICQRLNQPYVKLTPADILEKAKAGDPVCLEVCEVRGATIMGALGDMALLSGARGGVVLAGGVSERLIDYIDTPKALERYTNHGPRSDYVRQIPIRLLQNPAAPLYGAAALYMDNLS